jgi:hypothetical protein
MCPPHPTTPNSEGAQPAQGTDRGIIPPAGAHRPVVSAHPAQQIQEEGEGVVGDFFDPVVRDVDDPDATSGRRRDVHVVDANSVADEDPASLEGGQHGRIDRGVLVYEGVGLGRRSRGPARPRPKRSCIRPAARRRIRPWRIRAAQAQCGRGRNR